MSGVSPYPVGSPSGRGSPAPRPSTRKVPYEFLPQLHTGEAHEQYLDGYFSQWWTIIDFSEQGEGFKRYMQQLGVDRLWINKDARYRYTVEYKADERAAETGNGFVETLSNSKSGRKGWAYTSTAQILVYYIPPTGEILFLAMVDLRKKVVGWEREYICQEVPNSDYTTRGVLVPLPVLRKIALRAYNSPQAQGGTSQEEKPQAAEMIQPPDMEPDGYYGEPPGAESLPPLEELENPQPVRVGVSPQFVDELARDLEKKEEDPAWKAYAAHGEKVKEPGREEKPERPGTGEGGKWDDFDSQFPDDPVRAKLRRKIAEAKLKDR